MGDVESSPVAGDDLKKGVEEGLSSGSGSVSGRGGGVGGCSGCGGDTTSSSSSGSNSSASSSDFVKLSLAKSMEEEQQETNRNDRKRNESGEADPSEVRVEEEGKVELLLVAGDEEEDAESVFEMEKWTGLAPRTIPFRSASFSQVDITSEGKYIRSPITLKPTAFCLLNNSYANTLPRTHHGHHHKSSKEDANASTTLAHDLLSQEEEEPQEAGETQEEDETLIQEIPSSGSTFEKSGEEKFVIPTEPTMSAAGCISFNSSTTGCGGGGDSDIGPVNEPENPTLLLPLPVQEMSSVEQSQQMNAVEGVRNALEGSLMDPKSSESVNELSTCIVPENDPRDPPRDSKRVVFEVGDPEYIDPAMDDILPVPVLVQKDETTQQGAFSASPACSLSSIAEPKLDEISEGSSASEKKDSPSISQKLTGGRPPLIIREESLTLGRSSSEEGPRSDADPDDPITPAAKAKKAFKMGLHAKLPLLDLDGCGGGGGSSISGSGGEDDNASSSEKFPLYRQSSGQSDASDEQGPQNIHNVNSLADPSSPPTLLRASGINSRSTPLTAALALDSMLRNREVGKIRVPQPPPQPQLPPPPSSSAPVFPGTTISSSFLASSPPPSTTVSSYYGSSSGSILETPGSPTGSIPSASDLGRANSLSSGTHSLPPRRYSKRPLRGPYGEMLEAEMNKVMNSRRNREYDSMEFFRESKSSSPSRSPPLSQSTSLLASSTGSPKLANALLMASMDDLNLSASSKQSKHASNPRCRKISTNLPVSSQPYHSSGEDDDHSIMIHRERNLLSL
jgi:hypothetical protein